MPSDLKDRPQSNHYDDNWKPSPNNDDSVDDSDLESSWNSDNSGYDQSDPASKAKKSLDGDELASAEQSATSGPQNNVPSLAGEDTQQTFGDTLGRGYRKGSKGGRFKAFTQGRSAKIGGGVVIAGGGFGIATIIMISSPNMVVNHYADLLTSGISRLQTHHSLKYRNRYMGVKNFFSKDGRIGGKVISDLESKGYRFSYDADGKTVKSMTTPKGINLADEAIGNHISDYMEKRHPLRTARWKTARTEALYRKFGISRSPVTLASALDEDPDATVNKRMANDILTDEIDENIGPGRAPPNETDEQRAAREAKEQATKDALLETDTEAKAVRRELLETGRDIASLESVDPLYKNAVSDIAEGASSEVLELAEKAATGSVGSRIWNGAKGLLNPTDILDKTCTLKNRLRMSVMVARNYRALSMLKYAAVVWAVADNTRQGKASSKELNSFMKRITGLDKKGNGIGDTQAYTFATKGFYSKSKNKATKSRNGVDGSLNGVMAGIQKATDNIPGTDMSQCGVIQNPIFQVGSTVLITFGTAIASIFTGGGAAAAEQAAIQGARIAAERTIREAIEQAIRQIFTKKILKQIALSVAIDLSFEGALALTQYYIEQGMALNFTAQEKGGDFSTTTIGGGSIANKQRGLQAGLVPVSSERYGAIHAQYIAELKQEQKNKSMFARIFDANDINSLAYSLKNDVILKNTSPAKSIANLSGFFTSAANPANFVATAAGSLNGTAMAAADDNVTHESYTFETGSSVGTDVAVDFSGNPIVVMRDDIAGINPEQNIDNLVAAGDIDPTTLQPTSERFTKHIENCVENMDILSQVEFEDTSIPEHDCMAKLPITVKFKAHLAYLDMLDGIESEFDPSIISEGDAVNVNASNVTNAGLPTTIATGGDTSNIPCSAGTDGGVQDGYLKGVLTKIRVCNVGGGFIVNSQVSAQVSNMFKEAGKVGLSFVAKGFSGSFRTMDAQIAVYNNWCKSGGIQGSPPPYPKPPGETIKCPGGAAPGYSNHQMGLALDLGCNGSPIPKAYNLAILNPCFKWLQTNARNFGFFELGLGTAESRASSGYEGWHWSVNGN